MRYAIISDVHANAAALRAVLQDAADAGAERIVCLGDVLGYGPEPVEALELVYRRVHVCLTGNHDDAVAGCFPTDAFTPVAAAAVNRHRAALAQSAVDWLRRLPYTCEFPGDAGPSSGSFACSHGDFADPRAFDYVLEPADATPSFLARAEPLLFVGHTHAPAVFALGAGSAPVARPPTDFALVPGERYLVNVGSVGYPRSGDHRSTYCIYDDVARTVAFRSLPFDLEGYRAKMRGQGLDEAPWMRALANRAGGEVRGAASFGRRRPAADPGRTQHLKVSAETVRTPSPAPSAPLRARRAPDRRVVAAVLAALIVSAAGIWCAKALVGGLLAPRVDDVKVVAPEAAEAPPPDARFSDERPLAGGWKGLLEFPGFQTVRIGSAGGKTVVQALRIESAKRGTVRLVKTLPLMERPPKVHWSVALASAAPGRRQDFQFNVHLSFFDARGSLLAEEFASGRRSAANRATAVPPGAETAEMTIDCTCAGVYDLAVPYFRTEPERRPEAGARRKRKENP